MTSSLKHLINMIYHKLNLSGTLTFSLFHTLKCLYCWSWPVGYWNWKYFQSKISIWERTGRMVWLDRSKEKSCFSPYATLNGLLCWDWPGIVGQKLLSLELRISKMGEQVECFDLMSYYWKEILCFHNYKSKNCKF